MRSLFSTFPTGWPGVGLLLQRMLTATLLLRFGVMDLTGKAFSAAMMPQVIGVFAGVFLLVGLCTPVIGGLVAAIELWIALTQVGDPRIPILLACLGGTAAMIGPGVWSIDARLFGRKHIDI